LAPFSTIGGGDNNNILGTLSYNDHETIPGGDHLTAESYAQTVLGAYNVAQGSSISTTFPSANPFDRLLIIGNGTSTERTNAYEVTNDGHAIAYGINASTDPEVEGARSIDNTCIAWGNIPVTAAGFVGTSFGLATANWVGNVCTVVLDYVYSDTYTGHSGQVKTCSASAITVTPVFVTGACVQVSVEQIITTGGFYSFKVHTFNNCSTMPEPFMFHVFARP
jgi:hypothetical protein